MKRGGGRRFYRPEDVDLLRGVRHLLYGDGYTIRGVQRILREQGAGFVQNVWRAGAEQPVRADDDRMEDDVGALADGERAEPEPEPDLALFAFGSLHARPGGERAGEARQPRLPDASVPASVSKGGVGEEEKRKLRSALGELIACQQLLEGALADSENGDQSAV